MNIKAALPDEFVVRATRREIRIIKDCILNLANFSGEDEFDTYVGASKVEAKVIMNALVTALKDNPL